MHLSFPTDAALDRRSFLAASTMLCLTNSALPKTHKPVGKADAKARTAAAMQMATAAWAWARRTRSTR